MTHRRLPLLLPCLLAVWGLVPARQVPSPASPSAQSASVDSLSRMAEEVSSDVEKLRGWSFRRPVRRERVDQDVVRRYLRQQVEASLPAGRRALVEVFLQTAGLVPPGIDLVGAALKVLDQQVAGYYDPSAGTLYLVDRAVQMPEFMQRAVLAHELTHALDDQQVGIGKMTDPSQRRTEDEDFVLSALGEGSATALMFHYLARQMAAGKVNAAEAGAYFSRELEHARTLEGMPRYFNAMFGSYLVGATFLARGDMMALLSLPDDRAVGESFRTAWATPPRSSEQVLHPEKYWSEAQRDEPVLVDDAAVEKWLAQPGRQIVHRNTLGELLTAILTERRDAPKDASKLMAATGWTNAGAAGWGGDRFYLLAEGDTQEKAAQALKGVKGVWVTAWDTPADRDEFVRALESGYQPPHSTTAASGARAAVVFIGFDQAERDTLVARLQESPLPMSRAGKPFPLR